MTKLYAPNIHLFASHIHQGLGSEVADKEIDREVLWKSANDILDRFNIGDRLSIPSVPNTLPRADLFLVKDGKQIPFKATGTTPKNNLNIAIRAYAWQIRDSYVLAFNLRRPEKENGEVTEAIAVDDLSEFNSDRCFNQVNSNLGKTILITAFLAEKYANNKSYREMADDCLRKFLQTEPPPFNRSGKLFNSSIFEYGIPTWNPEDDRILVWFFDSDPDSKKFVDNYPQFSDLFFYHSKIVSAYRDSRQDYKRAFNCYSKLNVELEKPIPKGNLLSYSDLDELQNRLRTTSAIGREYSILLRNLEHCRNTIAIHSHNYKQKLDAIAKPEDSLEFLKQFLDEDCPQFERQIQADLEYFLRGSELLDRSISTIRTVVEIDRNRRDRQLQHTVEALGLGVGAGAIVASTSGLMTQSWQRDRDSYPPPFFVGLTASFAVAIAVWGLAKYWLQKRDRV